jgi:hypothetical protein
MLFLLLLYIKNIYISHIQKNTYHFFRAYIVEILRPKLYEISIIYLYTMNYYYTWSTVTR